MNQFYIINYYLSLKDINKLMTEVFNVKYISKFIKNHIDLISTNYIWIEGEIQNYRYSNKHQYFSLYEETTSIKAIIWESMFRNMKIKLENGQKGKFYCKINYYQQKNDVSVVIYKVELEKEIGEIYRLYEENNIKCKELGYFDKRKTLPRKYENVAIITRFESAAYNDIINVLEECCKMNIYIYDSGMQGERSVDEIKNAIETLNKVSKKLKLDAIIITRGGGSIDDLWIFNDMNILTSIFNSNIPIFTGIGHNIDHSLSDEISDRSFITPTDIGRYILSSYSKSDRLKFLNSNRDMIKGKIEILINDRLKLLRNSIDSIQPEQILDKLDLRVSKLIKTRRNIKNRMYELVENSLDRLKTIKLETKDAINSMSSIKISSNGIDILEPNFIEKGKIYKLNFNNKSFKIKIL